MHGRGQVAHLVVEASSGPNLLERQENPLTASVGLRKILQLQIRHVYARQGSYTKKGTDHGMCISFARILCIAPHTSNVSSQYGRRW
jgi:hypothetical protein